MEMIQEGDILIFEDGTELKVDNVEYLCHDGHTIQYVKGTIGKGGTYTYVEDGVASSINGLNGRIIKCLRP